jgi:hypothetical protein
MAEMVSHYKSLDEELSGRSIASPNGFAWCSSDSSQTMGRSNRSRTMTVCSAVVSRDCCTLVTGQYSTRDGSTKIAVVPQAFLPTLHLVWN